MHLEIITIGKSIFSGEVELIKLPGTVGSFEILKNHAPCISTLEKGKIKIIDDQKQVTYFEINSGLVEVVDNQINVLVE